MLLSSIIPPTSAYEWSHPTFLSPKHPSTVRTRPFYILSVFVPNVNRNFLGSTGFHKRKRGNQVETAGGWTAGQQNLVSGIGFTC